MNRKTIIAAVIVIATCSIPVPLTASDTTTTDTHSSALELPIPDVPSSLRAPKERAAYILNHFWDTMEWTDTVRSLNTGFMEQNMVNFINMFQHADSTAVETSVNTMMDSAASCHDAYAKIMDIAEIYTYDPYSPMHDEESYRIFLNHAVNSTILTDEEKTRFRYHLSETDKNRRGTPGADFTYIDTDGQQCSLYTSGVPGAMKLVIFYDPECGDCAEIITWLSKDSRVNRMINDGKLCIIGIYPDGDPDGWEKARTKLPATWINGYSPDGYITEHETYSLRVTPTIYLLTPGNVVAGKDLSAIKLDEWLSHPTE